jgi:hypothetical protein
MMGDFEAAKTVALFSAGPVVKFAGRWYITSGNPGFNSKANNGFGYNSEAKARKSIRSFGGVA